MIMKKTILLITFIITLLAAGCGLSVERTGSVIVEGKNTNTYTNGFRQITEYEIYGSMGDEFIKFRVAENEYNSISTGDTVEIYRKFVYRIKRQ